MRVVVSQFEGIDATPALPLAAGCLIAAARREVDADYAIALERAPIARAVADLARPDVLGLSLYPWNATYSLAVAAEARRVYPEALIVAGGPSVPRRPERARRFLDDHPALDAIVFAEGELAFRSILRDGLSADIPGIAFRAGCAHGKPSSDMGAFAPGGNPHVFTTPPGRVHDFTATASPYLDGTFDQLIARHRARFSMALCETNRGCPFSCTFCDWSLTKHVVEFPIARVEAELEWVARHDFRHIMLADANFGIRPRDTAIARHLASLRHRFGSPTSFYFYLTKNDHARNLETIEILREANIATWVGLAVQDFDDHVLEAVKRSNIQTGESMKLRAICGELGMPTYNELILGLPGQTYASFADTIAQAMPGLPRHTFVLFLCRLIDNAELGDPASRAQHGLDTRRCEWRSSTPGWDPIIDEQQEVVVATNDLPLADWQRAFRLGYLAAALYNLRLLRVVLHHVDVATGDLRGYLAHLVLAMEGAPSGSVFAELRAIFDRYLSSLLASGPFLLPCDELGCSVPAEEAVAVAALAAYPAFLSETAAHTARFTDAPLDEAFRYQALITPFAGGAVRTETFTHDWPAYTAGTGASLTARPTAVTYQPPTYAAVSDFAAFVSTHLACVKARLDIGDLVPEVPGTVVASTPLVQLRVR